MPTLQKILVAGLAASSLLVATTEPAEARRHGYGRYYYAHPHYYRTYGYRGGYYGSAYGYRCQPEIEGHIGPKTCAYRR